MPVRVTIDRMLVTEAREDGDDRNAEWHMNFSVAGGGQEFLTTTNNPFDDTFADAVTDGENLLDAIVDPTFETLLEVGPGDEVTLEAQGFERSRALGGADDLPLPSSLITVEMPATPFDDLHIETFERNANFGYLLSWDVDFMI